MLTSVCVGVSGIYGIGTLYGLVNKGIVFVWVWVWVGVWLQSCVCYVYVLKHTCVPTCFACVGFNWYLLYTGAHIHIVHAV